MRKLGTIITLSSFFLLNALFSHAQESFRHEILKEVNAVRKSGCRCGEVYMPPVPVLRWSPRLEKAALRHARDMYLNEHFEHVGTDGSTLKQRIEATGYRWRLIGENLAYGDLSPKRAVAGWKASPDHCKTMMNPDFTEMGAANKGNYWVMDLGAAEH